MIALLAMAGCSVGGTAASTSTRTSQVAPSTAAAAPASCALTTSQDLIYWEQVPGAAPDAQIIGDVNYAACKPTVQVEASQAPRGPGYCTILARKVDNPGYDADAVPAARPNKPLIAVGGGC